MTLHPSWVWAHLCVDAHVRLRSPVDGCRRQDDPKNLTQTDPKKATYSPPFLF
jgi:hypothetical protein